MLYLFVFLLGVVFGSFLNVVILRLPEGQSIAYPGSHCPKCGQKLRWWHNIPLLSWLFLGGKCAYCKAPISIQYPLVELGTGFLFLGVFFLHPDIYGLVTAIVFALLLALALIDLRYKAVPDSLNLTAALLAIFSSADILANLKNALLVAGALAMLRFLVSYYVSKKEHMRLQKLIKNAPWLAHYYPRFVMIEAMGEGDIIVGFAMGAILGLQKTLLAIFLAALFALPASIYTRWRKGEAELPFIPFLVLGSLVAYVIGDRIWEMVGV